MLTDTTNWRRLYTAAALAGGGLGLLLVLGALPAVPPQVTSWMLGVDRVVAVVVPIVAGAVFGLLLAGVAQLGVAWQLRRRFSRRRSSRSSGLV